jgi:DNA repair exonuclease SbcCD ATPase subunit
MQESKAISSEIQELFQKISEQAEQYSSAYVAIDKKINQLDELALSLEKFRVNKTSELEDLANSTKWEINKSLEALKSKLDKAEEIYEKLNDILELKRNIHELSENLKNEHNSAAEAIRAFKTISANELDSTLNGVRFKVEKEIEGLAQKFEMKIDFKLKRLESQLFNYDQKIAGIIEFENGEFKKIRDDLDSVRGKVHNLFQDRAQAQKKSDATGQIELLKENIDERILSINREIIQMKKQKNDIVHEDTSDIIKNELRNELNQIADEKFKEIKKTNKTNTIAIITIVISLISILISVLNSLR